jgi:hypothetical protein
VIAASIFRIMAFGNASWGVNERERHLDMPEYFFSCAELLFWNCIVAVISWEFSSV